MNAPASEVRTNRNIVYLGDCLDVMREMEGESIDMIYLDPPFFSNKVHALGTRDRTTKFSFNDLWSCHAQYAEFMHERLSEARRLLKKTGTIYIHCDKSANHIVRLIGDDVFGSGNFLSEIIWAYKRWSNSANNLTPNHQTILFYGKSEAYSFNKIYTDYSETTNVDQILQKRTRDEFNKSTYARDAEGDVVVADDKKGVPLSDVWEIPFLNPKARERTGYPTQKPILLLERLIELTTKKGDVVFDPFCGSGTTLVAAKMLERNFVGVDISQDAVSLCERRLAELVKTESALLKNGRASYIGGNDEALELLAGLDFVPVHRNAGIDAILRRGVDGKPVPIRVQRAGETVHEAGGKLEVAARKKGASVAFLVLRNRNFDLIGSEYQSSLVRTVDSVALSVERELA